jgi:crossover junction endodeoxyribonuclease RuvC
LVSGRAFNQILTLRARSGRGGRRFKSCHSDQLPGPTAADPERYPESFPRQHHSTPERAIGSVCGIDIDTGGGIASLGHAGELLAVEDLPALPGLKGRAALNGALLALVIRRWSPTHAYVEFVASRPTDSRAGAFSFGRARGCTEGVLAACGVPARWLTVPVWRKLVGLPPAAGKDHARGEAIRRWPRFAESFARVRDADRAKAALIGPAGILRDARQAVQVDPEPIGRFSDLVVA